MRRNYSCYKKEPLPKHSIPYPGTSTFKGYTNLLINSSGQKLYVNCMDHNIYCFNLGVYASQPLMTYIGLTNSTFYIKSSLSPDDQYLISGSSDEKAYVWNVNSSKPLLTLTGHTKEVTCVAWSKTNDIRIVTCSDDARHKIWRIKYDNLDEDTTQEYRGNAIMCTDYRSGQIKSRFKALENTPKSIRRLAEVNETTPSSTEKISLKRSYSEMCASDSLNSVHYVTGVESKRQLIETRARRLFAPTTSNHTYCAGTLPEIAEETETPPKEETEKLLSPLNERNHLNHQRLIDIKTPSSTNRPSCSLSLFSPTSNLPNYVIDGDAPHLKLQSPKRKLKENVDWLTKIRKQKLLSTINSQLNEKLNGPSSSTESNSSSINGHNMDSLLTIDASNGILSPRMRKLKSSDRSAYGLGSPTSRRMSSCHQQQQQFACDELKSTATITTPTRRHSETTILRFFCVTPSHSNSQQNDVANSIANAANHS